MKRKTFRLIAVLAISLGVGHETAWTQTKYESTDHGDFKPFTPADTSLARPLYSSELDNGPISEGEHYEVADNRFQLNLNEEKPARKTGGLIGRLIGFKKKSTHETEVPFVEPTFADETIVHSEFVESSCGEQIYIEPTYVGEPVFEEDRAVVGGVNTVVSVSGLLFDQTSGETLNFSTNAAGDFLSSSDAANDDTAGIDVAIARRRAIGIGWEARYFELFPDDQTSQIGTNATTLLPGLAQIGSNVSGAGVLTGPSAADVFDDADTHVLTRQTELRNVEINLLKSTNARFRASSSELMLGFRYFEFGETLLYQAVNIPAGPPATPNPSAAGYFTSVENELAGVQLGARSEYQVFKRLMLQLGWKGGVFNNSIRTRQRVEYTDRNNGSISNPIIAGGDLSNQPFDIAGSDDVNSILGEVDFSVSWQFNQNARVRVGYRGLAASDIAFASTQIQDRFNDSDPMQTPNTNGNLVLQGGYLGLEIRR